MTVICIVSDKSVAVISPDHNDTEKALSLLHAGKYKFSEITTNQNTGMDWDKAVKWLSVAYQRMEETWRNLMK